jgi:hypothetical protein
MVILEGPHYRFYVPDEALDVREHVRLEPVTLHAPPSAHGGEFPLLMVIAAERDVLWYEARIGIPMQLHYESLKDRTLGDEPDTSTSTIVPLETASLGEPGEGLGAVLDGLGTGLCALFCKVFADETVLGGEDPDAPVASLDEVRECRLLVQLASRIERKKWPEQAHHRGFEVPLVWARAEPGEPRAAEGEHRTWRNKKRLLGLLQNALTMNGIFRGGSEHRLELPTVSHAGEARYGVEEDVDTLLRLEYDLVRAQQAADAAGKKGPG